MLKDYEEYFKKLDYDEEQAYENGFCPFTRKPCMGDDCQLSTIIDGFFYGCGLRRIWDDKSR